VDRRTYAQFATAIYGRRPEVKYDAAPDMQGEPLRRRLRA